MFGPIYQIGFGSVFNGSLTITGNLTVSGNFNFGDASTDNFLCYGVAKFSNGTGLLPSITFINDPDTGLYLAGVNILGVVAGGALKAQLSALAFSPGVNDGTSLGLATVSWSDLYLASGSVINWANGDITLTHSTNNLSFVGAHKISITGASQSAVTA